MCHTTVLENELIEKCIENGMPTKIINSIKYTMRKRIASKEINQKQEQQLITGYEKTNSSDTNNTQAIVSKCPFGYGKSTTPKTKISLTSLTTSPLLTMDHEFEFSNNNNNNNINYYEQFPQISQLGTAITAATATDNDKAVRHLSGHIEDESEKNVLSSTKNMYNDDILAKSTHLTKRFVYKMQQAIRRLQSSKIYTLLTTTTQPAHLAAIVIVTFVLLTIWPEFLDNGNRSTSSQQTSNQQQHTAVASNNDMLAMIAYLGAFSTHFGAQIWMTFVSGLALYFSLPRHIFGQCQQILFPKYFSMNAVLSTTMLIIYVKFFINTWTVAKCVQLGSLALTSAIEISVRLYLAPPMLLLMHEKYKIEGAIGSGKEVGSLVQGDLVKCPHYQRIHKAFRRLHMTIAIGNIIAMAGSCLQLYNIAGQLQISIVH